MERFFRVSPQPSYEGNFDENGERKFTSRSPRTLQPASPRSIPPPSCSGIWSAFFIISISRGLPTPARTLNRVEYKDSSKWVKIGVRFATSWVRRGELEFLARPLFCLFFHFPASLSLLLWQFRIFLKMYN